MLVSIGSGLKLEYGTARRWNALVAAVWKTTGRTLYLRPKYGAYRSRAMQTFLRLRYLAAPNRFPLALPPGQSNHEVGKAFDIANYGGIEPQIKVAAKKLGLIRDPSEAWHWNNLNPNELPPAEVPTRKRNSMTTLYTTAKDTVTGKPRWALAGDGMGEAAWIPTNSKDLAVGWAKIHGNAIPVTAILFDSFAARYTSGFKSVAAPIDTAAIAKAVNDDAARRLTD